MHYFILLFQNLRIMIATMFPLMRKLKMLTCFVQGLQVRAEQALEAKSSEDLANVLYHIFKFLFDISKCQHYKIV